MRINKLIKADEVGFTSYTLPQQAKKENRSASWFMKGATILSVLTLAVSSFVPAFAAPKPKIDICHATGSHANPYNGANADQTADAGGHDGHDGPVWFSGITVSWGDIIPPFDYDGGSYPGKNWTSEGQAILANGCNIPTAPTTGGLTVTKNTGNPANNATFTFTVSGGPTSVANFQITTVNGTGNHTITGLAAGTYTVGETLIPADWSFINATSTCDNGVAVSAGQTATCTMVNNYSPVVPTTGHLTLVKALAGDPAPDQITDWTLEADGPDSILGVTGAPAVTYAEVETGSYTLAENGPTTNYTASDWVCVDDGGNPVTVTNGNTVTVNENEEITCTITNTYDDGTVPTDTSTLTLVKAMAGDKSPNTETDWTLTATGPDVITGTTGGAAVTNATVESGTYTLSESGPTTGYTASDWVCMLQTDSVPVSVTVTNGNTVTLTKDQNVTCTITNTYDDGGSPTYSISGKVYHDNNSQNGTYDGESEGNPQGEAGLESWTVYLDENDNNSLDGEETSTLSDSNGNYEFTGLPAGCYTVREVLKDGWTQTEPTEVDDFEYQISLGGVICSTDSLITQITEFFVKTAQAQALPTYNFGNIERSDGSSGGGSRSGGSSSDDGSVLGDSTGLPYQAPEGRVLGASTLPVTGHEFSILLMILATAGFVFTPLVVSMATKKE